MKSFSKRITRRIVIALVLTLALVAAAIFYEAFRTMELMTSAYYGHVADIENESVEKRLHDVQVAIHNSIDEVEWQLYNPDSVTMALVDKLKLNPRSVMGFGAAFEPNFFPREGSWFEPYAVWEGDDIEVAQIGDASHNYFNFDWYRKGMEADKGVWSEPYFDDSGAKTILCTYVVPIHDKHGHKVGVFGGDLSVDMLHEYLKGKDLKTNTEGVLRLNEKNESDKKRWVYTFIVGREGYYITHPDKQRILRDNLFEALRQKPDTVAERMVREMIAGKKGIAKTLIDGVAVTVFYTPLEHTGWSLAVVLPESRLKMVVFKFCTYLMSFILMGLLAVYIICRLTIHRSTRPLRFLAKSADEVAKGNFNAPLPVLKHDDEIRLLRDSFGNMQQSLSRYIEELKTTTAQKSAIESELSIAHDIQMSMLPSPMNIQHSSLTIHAMLTPARDVGGDLYDYLIRDNRLFFCIGDVSGKGVPAALFMSTARGDFRLLAETESEPSSIVTRMNDIMAYDNELSIFVTFFVDVLDLETGHLYYCNAGHKAPFVLSNNKPYSALAIKRSLPVGAITDVTYTQQETTLAPGDTLFLYTDGLDEAEGAAHKMFGMERIKEVLQKTASDPQTLIENMKKAVGEFVGDTEQSDDLTMLAIQWKK